MILLISHKRDMYDIYALTLFTSNRTLHKRIIHTYLSIYIYVYLIFESITFFLSIYPPPYDRRLGYELFFHCVCIKVQMKVPARWDDT